MGEFSCCTADELVLVPPGGTPARRRKRADNAGVAQVRYTRGVRFPGTSSRQAATGRDRLAPGRRNLVGAPARVRTASAPAAPVLVPSGEYRATFAHTDLRQNKDPQA